MFKKIGKGNRKSFDVNRDRNDELKFEIGVIQ